MGPISTANSTNENTNDIRRSVQWALGLVIRVALNHSAAKNHYLGSQCGQLTMKPWREREAHMSYKHHLSICCFL